MRDGVRSSPDWTAEGGVQPHGKRVVRRGEQRRLCIAVGAAQVESQLDVSTRRDGASIARGRATMALETPEVIRRLFGGIAAVPTRSSRPPPKRSAGVPDPIFWKVLEYWRLGDWRRPGTLPDPASEE